MNLNSGLLSGLLSEVPARQTAGFIGSLASPLGLLTGRLPRGRKEDGRGRKRALSEDCFPRPFVSLFIACSVLVSYYSG